MKTASRSKVTVQPDWIVFGTICTLTVVISLSNFFAITPLAFGKLKSRCHPVNSYLIVLHFQLRYIKKDAVLLKTYRTRISLQFISYNRSTLALRAENHQGWNKWIIIPWFSIPRRNILKTQFNKMYLKKNWREDKISQIWSDLITYRPTYIFIYCSWYRVLVRHNQTKLYIISYVIIYEGWYDYVGPLRFRPKKIHPLTTLPRNNSNLGQFILWQLIPDNLSLNFNIPDRNSKYYKNTFIILRA